MEALTDLGYLFLIASVSAIMYGVYRIFKYMLVGIKQHDD